MAQIKLDYDKMEVLEIIKDYAVNSINYQSMSRRATVSITLNIRKNELLGAVVNIDEEELSMKLQGDEYLEE